VNLSELRTALKERREDFSPSDAKLNRKINQAYLDICSRRQWGWLRREFTANTFAPTTITGTVIKEITANNGESSITIAAALVPGPTVLNKRVIIDNAFYEVVDMNSEGTTYYLDRLYTGTTYPDNTDPLNIDYGTIKVIYDDIALPLGAKSLVESVLFSGSNSYPLGLDGISPGRMVHRDKASTGRPVKCSVIEKEPIHRPRSSISDFGALEGVDASGDLTGGAVYTYWYSFVDKKSGAESALSPSSSVTLAAGDNQVTLPDIVARTDYVLRIYRSTAGGSIPLLLDDSYSSTTSAYADDESDNYLGRGGPASASAMFLTLYPAPGSTYQVHLIYQTEGLAMGDDDDRPLFDASFSSVLLDGAEYLMLTSADEQRRATHTYSGFERGIARMMSQDRLNYQQRVLIGRDGRRLVGKRAWRDSSGLDEDTFRA